ncbi:Hypp4936 [Branchiostoma lanceolatum]|uniref:Hypp4936 protein n=1 Tax=Branchiostoma lanceolatum TaxID=7740 RepID=A0A8K0AF64_BRALA|nr:Hypp4936 [Branchiostoma lanceolatum]
MERVVCCALAVVCVFVAGTSGFELADMIARLQRQNGELTETVANLTAALEASGPDRVQELETENSVLKAEKATLQREISGLQQRIEDIELMYQTLQRRAAGSGAGTVHVAMTTASLYTGLSVVVLLTTLGCQR